MQKRGLWWQHEKYSAWKHDFSSNVLYIQCMISFMSHPKPRKTTLLIAIASSYDAPKEDQRNFKTVAEAEQRGRHDATVFACVRVAWRAGQWQRYGAHYNWICQNSPPVNVVPLLGKAAAHDLQLSLCDRWLYLLFCCCCFCCWR